MSSAIRSSTPAWVTESLAARASTAVSLWLLEPVQQEHAEREHRDEGDQRPGRGQHAYPEAPGSAHAATVGVCAPGAARRDCKDRLGRLCPCRHLRLYPATPNPPTPSASSPFRRICWARPAPTVACAGSTRRGSGRWAGRPRSCFSLPYVEFLHPEDRAKVARLRRAARAPAARREPADRGAGAPQGRELSLAADQRRGGRRRRSRWCISRARTSPTCTRRSRCSPVSARARSGAPRSSSAPTPSWSASPRSSRTTCASR